MAGGVEELKAVYLTAHRGIDQVRLRAQRSAVEIAPITLRAGECSRSALLLLARKPQVIYFRFADFPASQANSAVDNLSKLFGVTYQAPGY